LSYMPPEERRFPLYVYAGSRCCALEITKKTPPRDIPALSCLGRFADIAAS